MPEVYEYDETKLIETEAGDFKKFLNQKAADGWQLHTFTWVEIPGSNGLRNYVQILLKRLKEAPLEK